MFAVYIVLFTCSIIWIKSFYRTLFVPVTIIAVCWCLFPAIASIGVLGLYPIAAETHIYIILSYFIFTITSMLNCSKKKVGSDLEYNADFNEMGMGGSKIDNVNYLLIFCGNVIVALWLFSKLGQTLSIIQNYGFVYLRNIYENNFSTSTIVNIIYNWFAKPFVAASCAIFSIDVMQERKKQQIWMGIIILINVLLDTVIFAARATIVKLVIFFFFSLFFCKQREYTKKQKLIVVLIVISLMTVIVFMTGERMSESYSSFSFLDSIYMYYVAPFGLLNYYILNPEFSLLSVSHLTYGTGMFGAIYNIFRSALYILFNFNYNGSDYNIQLITQQTVRVGERVRINSACTADYIFLRDAGFIGIIIGFALLAYIVERVRKTYVSIPTVRNGALYVSLLYVTFRLSMSYDFLTPSTLFSLLFIILCTKKTKIKFSFNRKL